MFRKTITRLAYSPALAEELTDYARKLRREETKRQIGLIFVVLALIVQSFAVLFPPESANAGNTTDFIEGGFSTMDEYINYYDQNTHEIKDLFISLGISRADIQAARATNLETTADLVVWKKASRGDSGDTAYDFLANDGSAKTVYYHPIRNTSASSYKSSSEQTEPAYVGLSSTAGWFALLKSSGNLVTKTIGPDNCDPDTTVPLDTAVPVFLADIKRCGLDLAPTLSAHNISSGAVAASRTSQASDRIIYTLAITNKEARTLSLPLSVGLTDVLEYSQLMDKGGAHFDQKTKTLTWTAVSVPPGASLTRNFIVKLLPVIPSTATGQVDPHSYDCIMSSSFGETLSIPVACPFPKTIERMVSELPPSSLQANMIFAAGVAIVATYLYLRSRQLRTELRLIRHNYQGSL